jgi:ATP-dependent DNA helicase RecG
MSITDPSPTPDGSPPATSRARARLDLRAPEGPLRLELSRGCLDDAVEGGTGTFVERWARAAAAAAPADLALRLERIAAAFGGYAGLDEPGRRSLCERTLAALELYRRRWADGASSRPGPDSPLTDLRGVGPRRAEQLAALGIRTLADLLRHYPARHDDRRALLPITALDHRQSACLRARITGPGELKRPHGYTLAHVPATEGATPLTLVWFNQAYRIAQYAEGTELLVTGQVMVRQGKYSLQVAEVEVLEAGDAESMGGLTPIYPLTAGVTQGFLRGLVRQALERCDPPPAGVVPPPVAEARGLGPLGEALTQVHFPTDDNARRRARARIAYEELFLLQAALATQHEEAARPDERAVVPAHGLLTEFLEALPFTATDAQREVCEALAEDLERAAPANRLVHGDVGSGKTVCAAFALACASRAGRQAALMAPTELLAEQHWRTLSRMLQPLGVRCTLLTGSLRAGERARREDDLRTARTDVVVGTHALFQGSLEFHDLAVAVVDEQHRFGVRQRAELSAKGAATNVFVMSATPIPRTLALTAYGDFDVSVLGALPPGRQPVETYLAWGEDRRRAYETLGALMARGRQAYIICPLIEADDEGSLASAEEEHRRLSHGPLAAFRIGLLHGRIDPVARDAIMQDFHDRKLDALVATTVVEVGVDVPNATLMLVENAERFGLAQLHQLRGRVARGTEAGRCILMTRAKSPEVVSRLRVLERTTDGFEVAEEDLARRGPGELAGTRQSGLPDLRMADLLADTPTLLQAREDAFALVTNDPGLDAEEHQPLRRALAGIQAGTDPWSL